MSLFSPPVKEFIMKRTRKNGTATEGNDVDAKPDDPTSPCSEISAEDNSENKDAKKGKTGAAAN